MSDKIRSLRKSKGLSQETLAESAGISLRTLQRIETGNGVPQSLFRIQKLYFPEQ